MELANYLKDLLRRREIYSVREAARQIGISHTTLNRILEGERSLDLKTVLALSQWTGVTPQYLLELLGFPTNRREEELWLSVLAAEYPVVDKLLSKLYQLHIRRKLRLQDLTAILDYALLKVESLTTE